MQSTLNIVGTLFTVWGCGVDCAVLDQRENTALLGKYSTVRKYSTPVAFETCTTLSRQFRHHKNFIHASVKTCPDYPVYD